MLTQEQREILHKAAIILEELLEANKVVIPVSASNGLGELSFQYTFKSGK